MGWGHVEEAAGPSPAARIVRNGVGASSALDDCQSPTGWAKPATHHGPSGAVVVDHLQRIDRGRVVFPSVTRQGGRKTSSAELNPLHAEEADLLSDESLLAAMHEAIDPSGLMQRVADRTLELVESANGILIGLVDRQGVSYVWGAGASEPFVGTRVNMDSSLSGLAVRTRQITSCDDCQTDARADRQVAQRISVASAVCLPLARGPEMLGVLAVVSSRVHAFDREDVGTLTRLAGYVSSAIGLARDLSLMNARLLEMTSH